MKIVAIIEDRKSVMCILTQDEIAHIMGRNSIYSDAKEIIRYE